MTPKTITVTFTGTEADAVLGLLEDQEREADNNPYLGQKQRDLYDAARIRIQQVMYPLNFT